jgi:hypothetical protein
MQKFSFATIVITIVLLALSFVLYRHDPEMLLGIYARELGILR